MTRTNSEYVERGLSLFHARLRARDMKMSKVRDEVARFALLQSGNFCVLDLVQAMRRAGTRDVHEVTVYRAMPLLEETGLVRTSIVAGGDSHFYEVAFEREPLPRLTCTGCGRSAELRAETFEVLQRELSRRLGFELDVASSTLQGRCKKCQRAGAQLARAGL